jgi:hypothetical protein
MPVFAELFIRVRATAANSSLKDKLLESIIEISAAKGHATAAESFAP